ncbi:MAG: hypothetical protein FP814_03570 [Desulfobacterium sp.]|nr:hypothetical protein [Desulfobacterium sp.]MBU3950389.1 hypothetical protein [Pseudomonadota bacterium]MBU4011284.1 hypothetical protein [Pseudomonadota bacterium]MBU4037476.1 hypothetical protein [Pseudomonadota bacterium]
MYLYWRVQQDLNCLGETIRFTDPSFIRCHRRWLRKNLAGIALAEGFEVEELLKQSLSKAN